MSLFHRKEKRRPVRIPEGLSRSERKEVEKIVATARGNEGAPTTAQESIPFERMFRDGVCKVRNGYYTKTIRFEDINYQLATKDDQEEIFEDWCGFLNFFDSSVHFEFSFLNTTIDRNEFQKKIMIPPTGDDFDPLRKEYSQILLHQYSQGNNGLMKTKYLTFGVHADSVKQAAPRLAHIQTDILNNFRQIGVYAYPLDGKERLKVMHQMFHIGDPDRFVFDWNWLPESGLSVKDFIAPSSFTFSGRYMQVGGTYYAASLLKIEASQLSDNTLRDFLEMESGQIITMHVQPVDQNKAIKMVKKTLTEIDRSKIDENKKAYRAGYDADIMPSDLVTYGHDAKAIMDQLQNQDERFFMVTFLIINTGKDLQELKTNVFEAVSIAQKHNCNLMRLDYTQEQALMSSLPLADNHVQIERGLTTSATAIFVPFTTQELFQDSPEAVYGGLNALSNNLIMVDRKLLKTPNGLILGTPGSGKSFAAKREIYNVFLVTDDDIIICDPEAEYTPLVQSLKGQVVKISPTSTQYINPMDINMNYSEEDNPVSLKADFILSFCELIVGGKEGLQPIEKTVIDRCVHRIYQRYFEDPVPEKMPLLEDLYNELLSQEEKEAQRVATALEIYVKGSLNLFNHRTNVDISNRVVCYDIKDLGKQMKKLGMLIVQDQVWNRVTINRNKKKTTRYYIDEFHLLLREEQTAAYSVEIWKRFRKWGGIPTGITQNVKDLLSSREIENIFDNSDYICMLNQAAGDREILAKQLGISPRQLSFVTRSGEGEGLLLYGSVIIPFVDHFPKDTRMYQIMTTKLLETKEEPEEPKPKRRTRKKTDETGDSSKPPVKKTTTRRTAKTSARAKKTSSADEPDIADEKLPEEEGKTIKKAAAPKTAAGKTTARKTTSGKTTTRKAKEADAPGDAVSEEKESEKEEPEKKKTVRRTRKSTAKEAASSKKTAEPAEQKKTTAVKRRRTAAKKTEDE